MVAVEGLFDKVRLILVHGRIESKVGEFGGVVLKKRLVFCGFDSDCFFFVIVVVIDVDGLKDQREAKEV